MRDFKRTLQSIDELISQHEYNIRAAEKNIPNLKSKKENLIKIFETYPDAELYNGEIHIKNMNWEKVSGISIDKEYNYRAVGTFTLFAKFRLNHSIFGNIKIYMVPQINIIAQYNRLNNIKIFDYKNIVPDDCKIKKSFTRKIKKSILKICEKSKLTITNDSFYKEDFAKLMLLKD